MPSTLQPPTHYGLEAIRDEAKRLIDSGVIRRSAAIGILESHVPSREWESIASELERCDYQPHDPICDLLGCEEWSYD